jgi:histone chaperone ASF1
VSSPDNEDLDQELDDCLVGPIPAGVNAFEFEAIPPDPARIPADDVLGVAALILTGSYKEQEFVRVGYYQNTEYDDESLKESPPARPVFERLVRDISRKPRVTRFQIKWCVGSNRASASRLMPCDRDVVAPQAETTQNTVGAATSAAVPSANDMYDGEPNSMAVDS